MRLISAGEEALWKGALGDLRNTVADLRAQNADLWSTVLSLKMQGATAATPVVPLERREPDRITEVISDVAGSNGALRKQLTAYARAEKRNGTDEDDIVQALLHWGTDDEGTPE